MWRTKRFQKQVTAGRLTLPATVLISVTCWMLTAALLPEMEEQRTGYSLWRTFSHFCLSAWPCRFFSFLLYGIIGYFLIELNNTFGIIRMRASIQTAVYFLLISVCPYIHILYAGDLAAASFLIALFFLFKSYQQARSASYLFHAFVSIATGSLFFPKLLFFAPIFWIGSFNFRSLNPKSFLASLIGGSLPYWFLLGYSYIYGQMDLFYQPFRELVTFAPVRFEFLPWQIATVGYMFVLFLVSSAHCLITGYEDKIRTRSYLNFLIFLNLCIFVYFGFQPVLGVHLLSILLIGVSILAGHLFVLTDSRGSNLFFICALAGLFLLFGFNLWTLLQTH